MSVVELYATSKCNHSCNHCYLTYESIWNPDVLIDTAKSLFEQGYKVRINGAEILTNPDYLKAYKVCKQKFLLTNGILLADGNSYLFDNIKKNDINTIRISHHFDSIGVLNGVPSDIIERAIYNTQKNGISTVLHTTITSLTYDKVETMCAYAYEKKCPRIKFFLLTQVGNGKKLPLELFLSMEQKKYFYDLLKKCRKKYPIDVLEIRVSGDFEDVTNNFFCFFGQDHISITSDRMIYGCPFGVGNSTPIGYLNKNNKIIIEKVLDFDRKKCYLNSVHL